MKKTITLAVANRPENTKMLLDSLKNQIASLEDYTLYISADPIKGSKKEFKQVLDIIHNVDFIETEIKVHSYNQGVNRNTFGLMERVFTEEKADFNLYLEDDLVLSPDVIDIYDWIAKNEEPHMAMLCLFTYKDMGNGDPKSFFNSKFMSGWGFITDKEAYDFYMRDIWCEGERMWDNKVADSVRANGGCFAYPNISRTTNTGHKGTHFSEKDKTIFDKFLKGHKHYKGDGPLDYYFDFKQNYDKDHV